MLRTHRFKQQLFSISELRERGEDYFNRWNEIKMATRFESLPEFEKAALFLFALSAFRRPTDFLGGPHSQDFSSKEKGLLKVKDLKFFVPKSGSFQRLSDELSFLEVITTRTLRSIPLSVQRSLAQWSNQQYPLILRFNIPSSQEVLELQCQGKRVVSLLDQRHHFLDYVENDRDTLGFLVHDLIHADHFFSHRENADAQIQFCSLLLKLQKVPDFKSRLLDNPAFQKDFDYLSSDMNSVPLHLFKSLKAILLKDFKKQANTPEDRHLSALAESLFTEHINRIFQYLGWSPEALKAFQRLNTPQFSLETDYLLLIKNMC